MKKLIMMATVLITSTTAIFAQSGAMFIGGTAGFDTEGTTTGNNINDVSAFNYEFGPQFGYMINDNMAVGVNLTFGSMNTSTDIADSSGSVLELENKGGSYNIEPYLRYYFAGGDNFKFFADLKIGFGGGTNTESIVGADDIETKHSTFGINLNPGAQYWFNEKWSIVSTVGLLEYNSKTTEAPSNVTNGEDEVESGFTLRADFNLNFGFFYHF